MPSFNDLYFKFNKSATTVEYKIEIDSTRGEDSMWSATGTNYAISSLNGKNGDNVTFSNEFLTDGISTWKVWSLDDPKKYITITLDRYNNGDSEENANGKNISNAQIEILHDKSSESVVYDKDSNEIIIPCNCSSFTIDVRGNYVLTTKDSISTKGIRAKKFMLQGDIDSSFSDFNGVHLDDVHERVKEGSLMHNFIYSHEFSMNNNINYYASDVVNKFNFIYNKDTDVYETVNVRQLKPFKKHAFGFDEEYYQIVGNSKNINFNNETILYPSEYSETKLGSSVQHGTIFKGLGLEINAIDNESRYVTVKYSGETYPFFTQLSMTCEETNETISCPVTFFNDNTNVQSMVISFDKEFPELSKCGADIEFSLMSWGGKMERIKIGRVPSSESVDEYSKTIVCPLYFGDIVSINVLNLYYWDDSGNYVRIGEGSWPEDIEVVMERGYSDSQTVKIKTVLSNPITLTYAFNGDNDIRFNFIKKIKM